ncbi:MAG TPA: ABC transporter ATP-binding protein [Fibrobacteraceae bacterium]|nr:ABC transporter ATP-binding protein [Fibrobacteraceae bacterium]
MDNTIDIQHIQHDHAGEHALRDVSWQVRPGTLCGLIGADGAGKSTLFRILATLLKPQSGSARLLGLDVVTQRRELRPLIGYMPQRFSLYADLSVEENLRFAAEIMQVPSTTIPATLERLLKFVRLDFARKRRAGRLSGGMKQKLALCCALVRAPRLLLLDEPTVGVDPVTRRDFWDLLGHLREQGTTLLVSTPYMDEAGLCDQVILLHQGQVVGRGSPSELCAKLPGRLWKVSAPEILHSPVSASPPARLFSLYPSGGTLHVLAPETLSAQEVLIAAQTQCPQATQCQPGEPQVEDVLLWALRNQGNPT